MLSTILFWVIIIISSIFTMFWILVYLLYYKEEKDMHKSIRELPFVTIAIPCYNEEKNIEKTLNSLKEINYPKDKLQVIVVDDGSEDKTYSKIRSYAEKNKELKITLIRNKKNLGKGKSLNKALKKAKGKYFVVLDADTEVNKNALKSMITKIDNKKTGAVISHIKVKRSKNIIEKFQRFEYIYTQFMRNLMSRIDVLYITPGAFSIYKTEILKKIGGFDESTLTEDFEIALRIKYNDYAVIFDRNAITYTSIPSNIKSYVKQRLRWNIGFIENTKKYFWKFVKRKDFSLFGHIIYPVTLISLIILILYTIKNIYNFIDYLFFKIRSWIYTDKIYLWEYNSLREFILSLNYDIIIPFMFVILSGIIIYTLAFKHSKERIEHLFEFVLFFLIYSIITIILWIFSLAYYYTKYKNSNKRKWFK